MKGIAGYIISIFIACFLTILVFYFLGELLSSEIEISTISRKYSEVINEAEYTKFYFKEYLESKYSRGRTEGASYEAITKEIPEKISVSFKNSNSYFRLIKAYKEQDFFVLKGEIFSTYKSPEIEINLTKEVEFKIPLVIPKDSSLYI